MSKQIEKRENGAHVPAKNQQWARKTYTPNVDILETKDEVQVIADMPGVSNDSIDLHFENGELYLHGSVPERQPRDQQYLLREYATGDFYRVFRITEEIDAEKISAEYKDGVLCLHLPKVEAVKPRKIAVRTA